MKRLTLYSGTLTGVVVVWIGLELSRSAFESYIKMEFLHMAPLLVIALFLVACSSKLALDVFKFKDYSVEGIPALEKDIIAAKNRIAL